MKKDGFSGKKIVFTNKLLIWNKTCIILNTDYLNSYEVKKIND